MLEMTNSNSTVGALLWFIVFRLVWGSVGFVAFVIKFAHVVDELERHRKQHDQDEAQDDWYWQVNQVIALLGFCNQIFGITQLWKVQETRLLAFLFGGVDAQLDKEELKRQDAFLAEMTRLVCSELFKDVQGGFRLNFQRFCVMVTLSHLDYQTFVLEELQDGNEDW